MVLRCQIYNVAYAVAKDLLLFVCFFFEGYGDHRDLHRVDRRQRQMCIRDSLRYSLMSLSIRFSRLRRASVSA